MRAREIMSAKPEKVVVKISDLLQKPEPIEVSPGKWLEVNALSMEQIVRLFWVYQESFLAVYAAGQQVEPNYETLLVSAPDIVADIIAYGSGAVGQQADIKKLPGTVQLIALASIWNMSVPDPKKLKESLSMVMGQLRRLSTEGQAQMNQETSPSEEPQQSLSQT